MRIEIIGVDLPGRRCGPNAEGGWYENIHVGLGRGSAMAELVPGDAAEARWQCEVAVRSGRDGGLRLAGPFIRGKPGDYFLYLGWGTVAADGSFALFRAAKLLLADVDPAVWREALEPGRRLVGRLGLTDAKGNPRCARVRPREIAWSVRDA